MQTNANITLSDLELPFVASPIMDYHDAAIFSVGNKLVVGYLSDDLDRDNPLEDYDGLGKIYSSHRHSSAHAHSEMQNALGLDHEWSPDLDLVEEHQDRFRKAWIEAATNSREFIEWADETAGARASKTDAYYKRRARKLWDETSGEYSYNCQNIYDFEFTEDVREELWVTLRDEGLIGNEDAVLLDCYEHGGQVWSLSGGGMQCPFDTTRGAGVWVPDNSARAEIDCRAKVYAFGRIVQNGFWTRSSGKLRYMAVLDKIYGSTESAEFREWHEAFAWLEATAKKLKLSRRKEERAMQERRGRERAARELAESALEEYNGWLSGNCFGIVTATFAKVNGADGEPEYEFVESDECWGFIGDDYAMEEASAEAKNTAEILSKGAA